MDYQARVTMHEVEMSDAEEAAWQAGMTWLFRALMAAESDGVLVLESVSPVLEFV